MKYIIKLSANGEIIKTSVPDGYKVTLKELQKAVGGYIEIVHIHEQPDGRRIVAVVNEEGILNHLRFNKNASFLYKNALFGDVVILCAVGEELVPMETAESQFVEFELASLPSTNKNNEK